MSQYDNGTIYRRIIDEGFNKGELAVIDEVVSPEFREYENFFYPGSPQGPAAIKTVIMAMRTGIPDIHYEIEELVSVEDKIWVRLMVTGTHTGVLMGHEPTGRGMTMQIMDQSRFVDGKLIEHWGVPDNLGMFTQLGIYVPPVAATPVV